MRAQKTTRGKLRIRKPLCRSHPTGTIYTVPYWALNKEEGRLWRRASSRSCWWQIVVKLRAVCSGLRADSASRPSPFSPSLTLARPMCRWLTRQCVSAAQPLAPPTWTAVPSWRRCGGQERRRSIQVTGFSLRMPHSPRPSKQPAWPSSARRPVLSARWVTRYRASGSRRRRG